MLQLISNLIGGRRVAPDAPALPVYDPASGEVIEQAPVSGTVAVSGRGSFFGDPHVHGTDGIDFYTRKKMFISRW